MANNIVVGANAKMAIVDASFDDIGLTEDQVKIIYKAEANYKSWKPGRSLNAITGIQAGNGYLIIALQAIDLTAYFGNDPVVIVSGVPPGGSQGQVLTKVSDTDYDVSFTDETGGTGGGVALADGVVSGLALSATGLNVQVASGHWRVNGTNFTTDAPTDLTLEDADISDNRFDLIIGDNTGEISYVKGTATANPVKPEVPTNSIEIGFVLVTPTGTSVTQAPPADYVTSAELLSITGNKADLTTNNQNTLVDAVNEIASDVQQINQDNVILKIFKKTNYS